eukprot:scaffold302_cov247-Pinguiococcus_pyrenoidosus.AAC.14
MLRELLPLLKRRAGARPRALLTTDRRKAQILAVALQRSAEILWSTGEITLKGVRPVATSDRSVQGSFEFGRETRAHSTDFLGHTTATQCSSASCDACSARHESSTKTRRRAAIARGDFRTGHKRVWRLWVVWGASVTDGTWTRPGACGRTRTAADRGQRFLRHRSEVRIIWNYGRC